MLTRYQSGDETMSESDSTVLSAIEEAGRKLGYELRPRQREVALTFVRGRDVFVSLPTGSACWSDQTLQQRVHPDLPIEPGTTIDYEDWKTQDYPSVGQLSEALRDLDVIPIFAAVGLAVLTYENLAEELGGRAFTGTLMVDASNFVDLVTNIFNEVSRNIIVESVNIPGVTVNITPTFCPGEIVDGTCTGVETGAQVQFDVQVILHECTTGLAAGPLEVPVPVVGFGTFTVVIDAICTCPCEKVEVPQSLKCNGIGALVCGICECNPESVNELQCMGCNTCTCGSCSCNTDQASGKCDDLSCGVDATTGQVCNLNNLDTLEPIVRVSPASEIDWFGFAVVLHQLTPMASNDDLDTALAKTRIIIGAPKGTYPGGLPLDDRGDPHANETGLVYMCPVQPGKCEGVRGNLSLYSEPTAFGDYMDNTEGRLFDHFPNAIDEVKDGQLLGMTLFSNGDTFIACAPYWILLDTQPQLSGRCYQSGRTLQNFTSLDPCISFMGSAMRTLYCQSGTGVTAVDNSGTITFILGSPGFPNNRRGILHYKAEDSSEYVQGFLVDGNDLYQGFQVITGYINSSKSSAQTPSVIASMPRYNSVTYLGRVSIYDVNVPQGILNVTAEGQQMGEYFGYSLVAADLTGDGYDELIVGAPMYSDITGRQVEKGRVFAFENRGGTLSNEPVILLGEVAYGRFGNSLTCLGDVDNDGYEDIAVGAPYACTRPVPNCDNQNTGTVYIYYGRANLQTFGDQIPYRIHSDDIVRAVSGLDELFTFGFSLSSGVDIDNNKYNDLVVGAYESKVAIVIRSLPVADVEINLSAIDPLETQCMYNGDMFPCFDMKIEATYSGRGLSGPLEVNFTLSDVAMLEEQRILFFDGDTPDSFSGTLAFVDNDTQTEEIVRIYAVNSENYKNAQSPFVVEIRINEIPRHMAPSDFDGNQTLNDLSLYPRLRLNGTSIQTIQTICGAEIEDGYLWPDTPAGDTAVLNCTEDSTEVVTRTCEQPSKWLMADLSQCALVLFNDLLQSQSNGANVTADTYEEDIRIVSIFVENAPPENQTANNLEIVVNFTFAAATIAADPQTTVTEETVVDTIELLDGLSDWNEEVLGDSDDVPLVVQAFEIITTAFVTQDNFTTLTFSGQDIAVTADQINLESSQRLGELLSGFSNEGQLDTVIEEVEDGDITELAPQQVASAFLPPELFQRLGNDTEVEVIFALYEDGTLFPVNEQAQFPDANVVVGTPVLSATVGDLVLDGLSEKESVTILLQQNDLGNVTVTRVRCVSFNFDNLQWIADDCKTGVDDDLITCTCNHLTNFAALVDICSRTDNDCLNEEEQFILEVASIIGVVLSLLGITLTIINFIAFKKLHQSDVSKYHIQLCIALGLMLLVFVIGIDRTEVYEGCVTVSALIHYFTLVSVMWMGAEAVLMFQKVVIVFVQITTKYIIVVSLVCWLAPVVPVIIPLAINDKFMVSYTDSSETNIQFCFIGEVGVFFGAFLGPIIAILLFNCVIFFIVISVLIRHKMGTMGQKREQIDLNTAVRLIIGIAGVVFLFGLTWLFGAFTVAEASFAFQFLFVVFNTLQGFFIFFFFCVLSKDSRDLWIEALKCRKCKPFHYTQAMYTSSGISSLQKMTTTTTTATTASPNQKPTAVSIPGEESTEMPELINDPCACKDDAAMEEHL